MDKRAFGITYGDRSFSFQDLLKKDNSVSIHPGNKKALATEMFKAKNNITTKIMTESIAIFLVLITFVIRTCLRERE